MLRNFVCAVLISCVVLATNNLYAYETASISAYIQLNFANKIRISEHQLQQLSWVVKNKVRTFEMDMYVDPNAIHIEVTRALTRLYCLQLLQTGGKDSYNKFVAAQLAKNSQNTLSFNSFNKLAKHIQQLNSLDYDLIETSTILSAVSLSSEASRLAQSILAVDHVAKNNLDFLATTLRVDAKIYPVAAKIISEHDSAEKLLYVLFPPQTNFRHMLYTEGGSGMFRYLRAMIKHQYIKAVDLDLWYAYWITHIAGFRGHVSHDGSLYLNEPVFQAMTKLKSEIYEILESPNHDPLIPYLEYRAELLGFKSLPQNERLLLAHLGSLMRLYNVEDGRRLRASFMQLSVQQRQQVIIYFDNLFSELTYSNPTYGPALFGNSLELNKRNIEQTVKIILPFYCKAVHMYQRAYARGEIKPGSSLSFNKICATENIKQLNNSSFAILNRIKISADGEVQI